jgi:hypothetical protein
MAEQVSRQKLGCILLQAMLAQKNLQPQHERLLQVRLRLNQQLKPSDDDFAARLREFALDAEDSRLAVAAALNETAVMRLNCAVAVKHFGLASEVSKVYYIGIDPVERPLATYLELAAETGAGLALSSDFAAMPEKELFDALVAQRLRLPARPTTQAEAFSRVEAAFYALGLSKKHHLPRCIEHLIGIRAPPVTDEPEDVSNSVDAATEYLAKTDISDPAPDAAAAATGEPPQPVSKRSVDVDKAHDYLDRACTLVSLAVEHIDLAVSVLSSFLDLQEVAEISEMADEDAYISEVRALPGLAASSRFAEGNVRWPSCC